MAEVKVCDGCSKQSPDEQGRLIHHLWYKVDVTHTVFFMGIFPTQHTESYFLCESCMGQDAARSPVKKWLDKLVHKVKATFGNECDCPECTAKREAEKGAESKE